MASMYSGDVVELMDSCIWDVIELGDVSDIEQYAIKCGKEGGSRSFDVGCDYMKACRLCNEHNRQILNLVVSLIGGD